MNKMIVGMVASVFAIGAWAEGEITGDEAIKKLQREAMSKISDFALVPARVHCPAPEVYSRAYLAYAMNAGLAVTKGGRIWSSFVPGEDGPRAFIAACYSDDRGETWGDTALVIDPHDEWLFPLIPRLALQGTLWTDPDGRLHCFYQQSMGLCHDDYHCTSTSDGRMGVWDTTCDDPDAAKPRWSAPRRICDGMINNKPIILKDGTWLLPVALGIGAESSFGGCHAENNKLHGAWWFASTDKGKTWTRRGGLTNVANSIWFEHMAVELNDGRLWMVARVNRKERGLVESYSTDKGKTWSKDCENPAINGPCSRFHLRRLKSGNLLFVKHGNTMADLNKGYRCNTRCFLSKDDGKTWIGGLQIEHMGGSYPDCDQAEDGTIYVTLDHGRESFAEVRLARFTEADIEAGKLVTPGAKKWMLVTKGLRCSSPRRKVAGYFTPDCREIAPFALPGEPCTKPAPEMKDEERLARYVAANWQTIPLDHIARVVGADPKVIVKIAEKGKLGAQPAEFPKRDAAANAATIRANWELLPYEQLMPLVAMNRKEIAAALKEGGLFDSLGGFKPKCNWLIEGSAQK